MEQNSQTKIVASQHPVPCTWPALVLDGKGKYRPGTGQVLGRAVQDKCEAGYSPPAG